MAWKWLSANLQVHASGCRSQRVGSATESKSINERILDCYILGRE